MIVIYIYFVRVDNMIIAARIILSAYTEHITRDQSAFNHEEVICTHTTDDSFLQRRGNERWHLRQRLLVLINDHV